VCSSRWAVHPQHQRLHMQGLRPAGERVAPKRPADLGFELRDRTLVRTPGYGRGQNYEARVKGEWVFVLTRGGLP
jgi:hypothetical protein